MRPTVWILAFSILSAGSSFAQKELTERLSEEHRGWLDRDVLYIITEREREVFLSLETLEERNSFIEAFWRKRDPNPTTLANEFRDEHERRLDYANRLLGRETYREGWRTDRGRYYIILGEPREVQRYTGYSELMDSELWFYQGEKGKALPAFFYLLFYKRGDVGEYELYHPFIDGPPALLRGTFIQSNPDNLDAIEALTQISPELAHASLSFDTGEPPDLIGGRPAMGTGLLLARIEESPKRAVRTDYADAWMQYGRRVSTEYSFNFVPNRHVFSVMAGPEATPIIHYSVELDPESFGLEMNEDDPSKYYTTLDVTFEATNDEGTLVVSTGSSTFVELTPAQTDRVRSAPFAFQSSFPLVPGRHTVSVILRNRALTNFTLAEREVEVPRFELGRPTLADIILCHATTVATETVDPTEVRTFQLGRLRLEPASDQLFAVGEIIHVFAQAHQTPEGYMARFELAGADEVFDAVETEVRKAQGGAVTAELSTLGMVGGDYQIRVRLMTPRGELAGERSVAVVLSPRTAVPRPGFVLRKGFNTAIPELLALARGDQLWNLGRFDAAQADFEKAVAGNLNLPHARWKLANAYLRSRDAERSIALLAPLEEAFSSEFEVIAGLGFAYYFMDDFQKATEYLEKAMTIRPPDTELLNAIGDCHLRLGNPDKAKAYFERSLELEPSQEAVKRRLAELSSQGS